MNFGEAYSEQYDRLYEGKDYLGEVDFVLSRTASLAGPTGSLRILDLGCGTGRHAVELVRAGHTVHGVDRSEKMLEIAEQRFAELPPTMAARASFQRGDVRTVEIGRAFQLVLNLFHVVCYLTTEDAVLDLFSNVRRHADSNAVYIFDFWNGDAVIADPPKVR